MKISTSGKYKDQIFELFFSSIIIITLCNLISTRLCIHNSFELQRGGLDWQHAWNFIMQSTGGFNKSLGSNVIKSLMTCPLNLPFVITITPVVDKKKKWAKESEDKYEFRIYICTSSHRHPITIEMKISKTNYILSKILV